MDDLWEDYKLHQYKEKYNIYSSDSETDSGSEFDDEEGNYCCNDDCCESSQYFVKTDGYVLCGECGTVQSSIISDENPVNNYTDSQGRRENKGHHGLPVDTLNPFRTQLTTFIPKGYFINVKAIVCEDCNKFQKRHTYKKCEGL